MVKYKGYRRRGFTLIELLIVVAIIGILAAIAIPNFLQAQTRAKVARVKSDHSTLGTALELYHVDQGVYPYPLAYLSGFVATVEHVIELTTPIDYLQRIEWTDPFKEGGPGVFYATGGQWGASFSYTYLYYKGGWAEGEKGAGYMDELTDGCVVGSFGPDHNCSWIENYPEIPGWDHVRPRETYIYDPTNGTVSEGDIARFIGQFQMPVPTVLGG